MTRLTRGELASLWVDEPVAPLHIALAAEFDAGPFLRGDGTVDTARIRAELVRRAGRVPALRRRVIWTRFGQGRSSWADDGVFTPGGMSPARPCPMASSPTGALRPHQPDQG